jgi:biopolymer transport protein ExbB
MGVCPVNTVEAIKHLFLDTGASWVLWMLAGLSVISVAIAIERFVYYRSNTADLPTLATELHARLERGDTPATIAWLMGSRSVAARIAAAGLRLSERGPSAVDKAMQSRTALEREELDRRLAFLGTLGNNAPFIGLFGTVIGVIQAFEELGHSAAGHAGGSGQVASGAVMSAIAEALVATAVGLAVALPAVAAYNYFQRRVEGLLAGAEVLSNLVLAFLSGRDA